MEVYRVKTKVAGDGTLNLEKLPFAEGDEVEVIIRTRRPAGTGSVGWERFRRRYIVF